MSVPNGAAKVKEIMKVINRTANWVTVKAQWQAGTPTRKLAERHKVSVSTINRRVRLEQWTPTTARAKKAMVAEGISAEATSVPNVDASNGSGIRTIGKGRSIGQPMGDTHKDTELLSKFGAVSGLSAPETKAVIDQAITEIELMRRHRGVVARASIVAENILTRLHALIVEGTAADVITFQTKTGEAYHRVPFLGDRESVSDALLKCANAISKLIPLERQAHGLTDSSVDDKLPQVVFNMPGVRVISVDGKGKITAYEDQPALIEGKAGKVTSAQPDQQR